MSRTPSITGDTPGVQEGRASIQLIIEAATTTGEIFKQREKGFKYRK